MPQTVSSPAQSSHLDYIDLLNVLACFGVVVLHCNHCFWEGPQIGRAWITANAIEPLFYWSAPMFFMISGVTLMDYRQRMNTRLYFSQRVHKTLIPYLLWTLIALAIFFLYGRIPNITLRLFTTELISPSVMGVYWFFPAIFGVYLCLPAISAIQPRRQIFRYLLFAGFIGQSLLPLLFQFADLLAPTAFVPTVATGYIFYSILGYELASQNLAPKQRAIIYLLGLCGFLLQMLGTAVLSTPDSISHVFKGYLNLPAVLQTPAIFVAVRQLCGRRTRPLPQLVTRRKVQSGTVIRITT